MNKTLDHPGNFSGRLKARRKALQLSQKQLSEYTGVSPKTIQKYEYGDIPKGTNLVKLSHALNCTIDWLLLGAGSGIEGLGLERAYLHKVHAELEFVPKVLPRLDSDGVSFAKNQNMGDVYGFRRCWIEQKGDPSQMVLMEVSGGHMSPEIRDGDTALVDRSQTEIYIGKIYAVSIGKEVMVRYVDRAPGKIVLRSANNPLDDLIVDESKDLLDPMCIIGRVVWWCRDVR
jgi:phage repressor protein C with HTH and peptisase S24 domain